MNKDTFCIAPFVSTLVSVDGVLTPCCEYATPKEYRQSPANNFRNLKQWRTELLEPVRQDLLNGVKNENCSRCWKREEEKPELSYRYYVNSFYKDFIENGFDYTVVQDVKSVTLLFGNFCNFKCIHCGPVHSSSHETEQKMNADAFKKIDLLNVAPAERKWYLTDEFISLKDDLIRGADHIFMHGGEPLITPEAIKFLESIKNPQDIRLSLTTNASVLTDEVFDMLSRFKLLDITVSLDGIEAHAEYVRYGCEWSTVDANLRRLLTLPNLNNVLNINHVLQHTSHKTLAPLIEYCSKIDGIGLTIGDLTYPPHLSINGLLPEDCARFIDTLEDLIVKFKDVWQIEDAMSFALTQLRQYNYDEQLNTKFKEYINLLDNIRGTCYNNVFSD